jgi:hypothetical protein
MREDLTKKMKANLRTVGKAEDFVEATGATLAVGAAEHLIDRGLIRKVQTAQGVGRAKGVYRLTIAGKLALAKL